MDNSKKQIDLLFKEIDKRNFIIDDYKKIVNTHIENLNKNQKIINSLMENTESMYQTNKALINKVQLLQNQLKDILTIKFN